MTVDARFTMPSPGEPSVVTFPAVTREALANGLGVWTLPKRVWPVVTIALVVPVGSRHDPGAKAGLAGLTGDLLDEGADGRDAIGIAEALAELGSELSVDVAPDATTFSLTTLARFLEPAVAILCGIVARPRLDAADFERVRELRVNRLRQLRSSASATADRVFLGAVFGEHPYGHGALGTTRSLTELSIDDARAFHATYMRPAGSVLIFAGDVEPEAAMRAAARHAGSWNEGAVVAGRPAPGPAIEPVRPRILVVDRAGATQTELRVGHLAPPRSTDRYHTLITLNALLGGQFSSRINQNLREQKGFTYGARTSFDAWVEAGAFSCETSVHGDATVRAVAEVLAEFEAVGGSRPAEAVELALAKSSLTRGYVRHFETPAHLARAAARLATYGLPPDTFDVYVPRVNAVSEADVVNAAREFVSAHDSIIVVVGDAARWSGDLEQFARPVESVTPEF